MVEGLSINQIFEDGVAIDEALRCAARAAHHQYARTGLSMPVWSHGRLEWVDPTDLDAGDAQAGGQNGSAPG